MDVKDIIERRSRKAFSKDEYQLIKQLNRVTEVHNVDNITRTHAYRDFFKTYPTMEWALLASMVSRNAGWSMTDLKTEPIYRCLSDSYIQLLFHAYERPNWLIFHDAYPQLLLYKASLQWKRPLFDLLKAFNVSVFMEYEWERFWKTGDVRRLTYALIINEQHVIEAPFVKHSYYAQAVFDRVLFFLVDHLRLNAVVCPDFSGALYGFPVTGFQDVRQRIELGKKLHTLLFHHPESKAIQAFALETDHTGSRYDYERYHGASPAKNIPLREAFNVVSHRRLKPRDWFNGNTAPDWFLPPDIGKVELSKWYRRKRARLTRLGTLLSALIGK
jgi:hypothetical protein